MRWPDIGAFGAGLIIGWAIHHLRGRHHRRLTFRFDWDDDSTLGSTPPDESPAPDTPPEA